jgi:carbonyl reductase 1
VEKFVNEVIESNFTAQLNICNALFPLLRSNARVVHVSSRAGLLNQISNKEIKAKFKDENLTVDDIVKLLNDYIE